MLRYEVRELIEVEMAKMNLIKGHKPNPMRIGVCSKTGDIIEPLMKP